LKAKTGGGFVRASGDIATNLFSRRQAHCSDESTIPLAKVMGQCTYWGEEEGLKSGKQIRSALIRVGRPSSDEVVKVVQKI